MYVYCLCGLFLRLVFLLRQPKLCGRIFLVATLFELQMRISLLLLALFFPISAISARDVWQWRGADRTGVYSAETNLKKSWKEGEPRLLWHNSELGLGYSPPAIVNGVLYLSGTDEKTKREIFYALSAKDGKTLWSLDYGNSWEKSYPSARLTPTIVGGKAYVMSGSGEIAAIDLSAKKILWTRDMMADYKGRPRDWGYAENLVVFDGKVFMTVGGTKTAVVALDAESGREVWLTKPVNKLAAYFSPIVVEMKNTTQIICGTIGLCFGIDVKSGEILWTQPLKKLGTGGFEHEKEWETNVAMPIFKEGRLFISSGNNYGAYMLEIPDGRGEPKVVWTAPEFDTHHGGNILLNGRVYGSTWINNEKGNWACYDWQSGAKIYDEPWPKHSKGSIVSADSMLYIYDELRGEIALVNPASDKLDIVGTMRVKMGKGKHWCHPMICDGVMYVRRGNVLMAYELKE